MTKDEVRVALELGKRIKKADWGDYGYVKYNNDNQIVDEINGIINNDVDDMFKDCGRTGYYIHPSDCDISYTVKILQLSIDKFKSIDQNMGVFNCDDIQVIIDTINSIKSE
jgi:predicted acetyltransferase